MKPPDHSRRVLTWVRDANGIEYWKIDFFSLNHKGNSFWFWSNGLVEVLHWQELSPKPEL